MLWNAVLLALREIRRNGLRSSLTTLGIVIGVAAVIVMVTLGSGATAQVATQIESLGSRLLTVRPGQRMGPGGASGGARAFAVADADALAAEVPGLATVAPVTTQAATAIVGNANWSTSVTGTTNAYFEAIGWTFASGRPFLDSEIRAGQPVCVIGATVRKELYGAQDPVRSDLRLGKLSCRVVGLLVAKGKGGMGMDRDDLIVVPLRALQRRVTGSTDVRSIQVSVRDGVSMDKAKRDIGELLRERRRLGPSDQDDFAIMDPQDIAAALTGATRTLTTLLAAVAAVSLLVGGIGIMNIMLVSVTERTREVGVRLAIGALEREVLAQFLVEAVVLSSLGGAVGVAVALLGAAIAAGRLGLPFVLDLEIVLVAFLFSAIVGILFGFFPARRAARLNPIDALRHE